MKIREVIEMLNRMREEAVIADYAIGGAVGATFYLEPVATLDIDVFVGMKPAPGSLIIDPRPIFNYLTSHGCAAEGEYIIIAGWPVQFLAPPGPLVDEALEEAVESDVEGAPARTFSAEHLAAICLQTGKAKDKARLLQFIESGALDHARFEAIVERHELKLAWQKFKSQFIED